MAHKYNFDKKFKTQLDSVKDEYDRLKLDDIELCNIGETIRTVYQYAWSLNANSSLDLVKNFMTSSTKVSPNIFTDPKKRIETKIYYGFVSWIQAGNPDLYNSIIIELLGFIIDNTTLYKKDRIMIRKSRAGYYLLDKNGSNGIQICKLGKFILSNNNDMDHVIELNSYFNIIYQIAKHESSFLSNLLNGKYKKNFKFQTLIDNILPLDELILDKDLPVISIEKSENSAKECLSNSVGKTNNTNLKKWQRFSLEPYMIEHKTGIFTAWKIYSMTYDLWKSNKKDTKICSKIKELTNYVTSIHNLDLRLYVLDYCDQIFQTEINAEIKLDDLLSRMSVEIKAWAEMFNDIYDKIFILLLYRYRKEEAWKSIFYIESEDKVKPFTTYSFSKIYLEIKELYRRLNSTDSYHIKELFYNLYSADTKSDKHKWFTTILSNVENFFNE